MLRLVLLWLLICFLPNPRIEARWSIDSPTSPPVRGPNDSTSVHLKSPNDTSGGLAQNEVCRSGGWVRAGLGNCYFGITRGVSLAYFFENTILSVRYLNAEEFVFSVDGPHEEPGLSYKELGVLVGREYKERNLHFSFSAGLGFTSGIDRGKMIDYKKHERINVSTVGIPFEASLRIDFWQFGIGGSWFGNLNNRRSFSGWIVELFIGVFDQ